jgi:hypothetical protein
VDGDIDGGLRRRTATSTADDNVDGGRRWAWHASSLSFHSDRPTTRPDPARGGPARGVPGAVVARRPDGAVILFFISFVMCTEHGARQTWTPCCCVSSPSVNVSLLCVIINARQRFLTVRYGRRRTTMGLYSAKSVVCPLPCASIENARQSLCCAFSSHCRAPETHGKAPVSPSERSLRCLHGPHGREG